MSQQYFGNMVLVVLLVLSMIWKNNSLAISISGLIFLSMLGKLGGNIGIGVNNILVFLDKYGLNLGVILLMMGILAPFTLGQYQLDDLLILKSYRGIIGLTAGIIVAVFASRGGHLLEIEPLITTSVVIGTIAGIILFKGYPVGPLIGSGIAYYMLVIADKLMKK